MKSYGNLTALNAAPRGAKQIGVYKNGVRVGFVPIGLLDKVGSSVPLYSFGIISDAHIRNHGSPNDALYEPYEQHEARLGSTLDMLKDKGCSFIISCGDLGDGGGSAYLRMAKHIVETGKRYTNSAQTAEAVAGRDNGWRVGSNFHWACGNHDGEGTEENFLSIFGYIDPSNTGTASVHPGRPYAFETENGDVFVIMHFRNFNNNTVNIRFTKDDIVFLWKALRDHAGQRILVAQHCPDMSVTMSGRATGYTDSGHWNLSDADADDLYSADELNAVEAGLSITPPAGYEDNEPIAATKWFLHFMQTHNTAHPGTVMWLHGHTHAMVELQDVTTDKGYMANIDRVYGCWSLHVPSVNMNRPAAGGTYHTYGQCYVATMYAAGMLVEAYDTANPDGLTERWIPGACYFIPIRAE